MNEYLENYMLKLKEKHYNYKYHMKCSRIIWGLILVIFDTICLYGMVFVGEEIFHSSIIIPGFLFSILVTFNVLVCYVWKKTFSPIWKYRKFVQKKLDYFIDQNGFCVTHKEKRTKNEVSHNVIVIDYLPRIKYHLLDGKLFISFDLDGSLISEKFYDLEQRLTNLFGLEMCDKIKGDQCIIYIFLTEGDKRITIDKDINYKNLCNEQEIKITDSLIWNFRKVPHALITGGTGSGKTFFLIYLIKSFNKLGADVKIIDPKRSDLSQLESNLGSENVAYDKNLVAKMLRETNEEMNKRYDEMRVNDNYGFGKDFIDYGMKPIVIFFDEVIAYMSSCDPKLAKEVMNNLTEIVVKGRQSGVFIVLSMQRCDTAFIGGALRDQLGLRVGLGKMSADGYSMVFGNEYRDLQLTNYSCGDGYIYIDGLTNAPRQFSCPFVSDSENILDDII